MIDFSFFDVLLDPIFVIDSNKHTVYCNEPAATLCGSSVRRMTRGRPIHDFIRFKNEKLLVMPEGVEGRDSVVPLAEMDFYLPDGSKEGKIQLSIYPFTVLGNARWIVFIRDVTLEEVLHRKYQGQLEEKEQYIEQLKSARQQLEDYSKNLEKMVEARTIELKGANQMLTAIMQSLGQGFLVFNDKGVCSNIYTDACEDVLECVPAGKAIVTVLNLSEAEKSEFEMWMKAVFSESLPFESLRELGPKLYRHRQGKHITLDYFAIRNEADGLSNIVLVATDRTAEFAAQEALEKERAYAKMVVNLVTNRNQFAQFLRGIPNHIKNLSEELTKHSPDIDLMFRWLHTLEGEAGMFSAQEIRNSAKQAQDAISEVRSGAVKNFREVKDRFILALHNMEESFSQFKGQNLDLLRIVDVTDKDIIEISKDKVKKYSEVLRKKGWTESECRSFEMEFLSQPLRKYVYHFNGVLEQICSRLGKRAAPIKFVGDDLRVNSEELTPLLTAFIHIFRNIADHGLEAPEERQDMGKSELGQVTCEFHRERSADSTKLRIVISDDGRGINPAVIRSKLIELGADKKILDLPDSEVIQQIFEPGFTSRAQAGEYSGRGVGLDAVKEEVVKLGGRVYVASTAGQGTQIVMEIPESSDLHLAASA